MENITTGMKKGNIDAIFEFQYGVCTGVDLEKILDERNIFFFAP